MADTILDLFFDQVNRLETSRVALRRKLSGVYREWTWRDYGMEVTRVAEGLRALQFGRDSKLAILASNRPEWLFFDLAAMALGGVSAGIYPNDTPQSVQYVVEHSEAEILVVDTPAQLAKTKDWREHLPKLRHVVILDPDGSPLLGKVLGYDDVLRMGDTQYQRTPRRVETEARAIRPETMSMMVYTSGTTGPPKGAMYSHANIVFEAMALRPLLGNDGQKTISFLPLCHIAERLQGELVAIAAGSTVNFAESIEKLKDNLVEVKPSVLVCVPRLWEKFQAGIRASTSGRGKLAKRLFEQTLAVGSQIAPLRNRGNAIPLTLRAQWAVLERLVVNRIRKALGIDRCVAFVSGAAPLSRATGEFFGALGIDILEAYGQTECVGVCTATPHGRARFGSVGQPIEGCEVRIAHDGEILVRGPNVFLGYYKDPVATAESVDPDGWLHTGDVGEFDADGYLRITDRKKDIIVTAGGKNVAPQNLEGLLKGYPGIGQVVVVGDQRKYLVALVTLDPTTVDQLCEEAGIPPAPVKELADNDAVRPIIQSYFDKLNQGVASYEKIKRFAVLPGEFTVDAGEITPTLKLKRRVIQRKYASFVESMYPPDTTD